MTGSLFSFFAIALVVTFCLRSEPWKKQHFLLQPHDDLQVLERLSGRD